MPDPVQISIIIPLYNEEQNIMPLCHALMESLKELHGSWEIIFVDDGSHDRSFEEVRKLCAMEKKIKGISLSRNFGHQIALMAGLQHASGNAIITMDADLQHPPEAIPF